MTTTETPAALVDRVWTEAVENGETDVIHQALTDDYACHTPSAGDVHGPDGFEQYVRTLREAFPDLSVSVEDRISTEDAIVDRYRLRGTHEGEFLGVPPTSTAIEFTGITIHYVEAGRIRTDVSEFDVLDVVQQLGAVELPTDRDGSKREQTEEH